MKIAARRSVSPSMKRPSAPTYSPGQGFSAVKRIVSRFSLWWTPAERRFSSTMAAKSVGGMTLCKRRRAPSPASARSISSSSSAGTTRCGDRLSTVNGPATRTRDLVLVGAVVEKFDVGRLGDRGVDLLLARDAALPPLRVRLLRRGGPCRRGLARDFPVLQCLAERGVELRAQRLKLRLPFLPDDVDLGVVGDRLQRDMRRALVDEALADVADGSARRAGFCRRLPAPCAGPRGCRRGDNRDSARSSAACAQGRARRVRCRL